MAGSYLLSVGIDIGTTTTHLVVSKLYLSNAAMLNQAPRLEISQKEIVHQGPVHFTPLTAKGIIDAEKVAAIVGEEYYEAGICGADVLAGALIITGETARLRNAEEVAHSLAEFAGDFVVASAGPNLEGTLAAFGSGAVASSKLREKTICNLDIGGGTVNAAIVSNGEVIDTACLAVGGRIIKLTAEGAVAGITELGQKFLKYSYGKPDAFAQDTKISVGDLWNVAQRAADSIIHFIRTGGTEQADLMLTDPLKMNYAIDEYWVSGGIAELMAKYEDNQFNDTQSLETLAPYRDIGVMLASSLQHRLHEAKIEVHIPASPIYATAIGAGVHTVQLSGSTVETSDIVLPLRNIPLVKLKMHDGDRFAGAAEIEQSLTAQLKAYDIDATTTLTGTFLELPPGLSYADLKNISGSLAEVIAKTEARQPHIIVVQHDVAAALGLLLRQQMEGRQFLVLDGVEPVAGDFIDIGKPLSDQGLSTASSTLPVVVKSLVFMTPPEEEETPEPVKAETPEK